MRRRRGMRCGLSRLARIRSDHEVKFEWIWGCSCSVYLVSACVLYSIVLFDSEW